MPRILCLFLLWLMVTAPALAQDSWNGLWRVSRFYDGKLDGTYHLFFSNSPEEQISVTAYTDDARPMILQDMKLSQDQIELQVANSVKQPLPLLFKLKRDGDRVEGEWVFSQMQLMAPVTGEAVGFRVTTATDWTPWPFLDELRDEPQSVIDLAGHLFRKAPRDDFEAFLSFWDREIESRYYFVVQPALYGDARSRDRRLEILRPFFSQLKNTAPAAQLGEFPAIGKRLQNAVRVRDNNATKLYLVNWPFLPDSERFKELLLWTRIPTPMEEASCACVLDLRERFLLTDGLPFAEDSKNSGQEWEEAILNQVLWLMPAPSVGVEVFRQGLVRMLTLEGREIDLVELEPERRAEMASQVNGLLLEPLPESSSEVQQRTGGLLDLGVQFARHLVAKHSLGEVLRRSDRDIVKDWQAYLEQ